jgi:putative MATE family efflux protein
MLKKVKHVIQKQFTKKENTSIIATEEGPFKKKELLEMPIMKAIVVLSIPLILTNVLFTLYQIIDAFWVGQLGKEAVAAIALSFPIFFMVNAAVMGLTIAGTILVSQYKGKKDQKNINFISAQTLSLLTILGVIISILGYFLSPQIVALFNPEPLVGEFATTYLAIVFLGTIFMFIYTGFSSILRGLGEVKTPLLIVLLTVILNFFLDPILMLGLYGFPKLGVGGIAWATTITQGISALIAIFWLKKCKDQLCIEKKNLIPKKEAVILLLKLGIPATIEFLSRSVGMLLVTFIVAGFGTITLAAYGIGMRIASFVLIPSFGISMAINTLIGQNLGAGRLKETKETTQKGMLLSFVFMSLLGLATYFLAPTLVGLFINASETEVLKQATYFLELFALGLGFLGGHIVIVSTYRGAGDTKTAMNLSILYVIEQTALCAIGGIILGVNGIWIAYLLSNSLMVIITQLYYWKNPITKSII